MIDVDPHDDESRRLWHVVGELVALLPEDWTLVGGLMVQLHALEHDIAEVRVTVDIDVLGQARPPGALQAIDRALIDAGFEAHPPDPDNYGFRYERDRLKRVDYDAWGVRSDTAPAFELAIGYAGGIDDPRTGLVRFGMRDYDPLAGRWTARDPALFGGHQANLYAYVDNNPVTLTDPSGLISAGATLCAGVCGGTKLSLTTEGVSICFEVGFGVGASVGVDPFSDLDRNTETIGAEASASAGVLGVSASVTLDQCGDLKAGLGASLGPLGIDENLEVQGLSSELDEATGAHTGLKARGGKLGAAAKVTATVCRQMLW